jgi:tRNA uridine 5-carbamoylmethylation protein Kti12
MKKKDVLNLIKYHYEQNEVEFKNQVLEIARDFDRSGDVQLSEYIMGVISQQDRFVPQGQNVFSEYLQPISVNTQTLPLPVSISDDIKGIINAVNHNIGINKFLFVGKPGSGKTESSKQVARLLNRELLMVDFNGLIDSKLGQTSKNLTSLFDSINNIAHTSRIVVLFDEIDALVLDRINSQDLREMGRLTSTFLKLLDGLNSEVVIIATTNLYKNIDKALTRRFDAVVDFDRYSNSDLIEISELLLEDNLKYFKGFKREMKLFRKILLSVKELPYPADLKNIIRTSLAFSNPDDPVDYLKRIMKSLHNGKMPSVDVLSNLGFTYRDMEILTGVPRSTIARKESEN